MLNKITLTKPVFERLLEHLVYIEESIDEIVDSYYPDTISEREGLYRLLLCYIKKIEEAIETTKVISHIPKKGAIHVKLDNLNEFPFVVIGSTIFFEDTVTEEKLKYRIVHRIEHNSGICDISYLSTTARKLLLKNVGSEVDISTPRGVQCYRVISITLH